MQHAPVSCVLGQQRHSLSVKIRMYDSPRSGSKLGFSQLIRAKCCADLPQYNPWYVPEYAVGNCSTRTVNIAGRHQAWRQDSAKVQQWRDRAGLRNQLQRLKESQHAPVSRDNGVLMAPLLIVPCLQKALLESPNICSRHMVCTPTERHDCPYSHSEAHY